MADTPLRAALVELIGKSATFEERVAGDWVIAEPSTQDEMHAICRAVGVAPLALLVRGPIAETLARARVRDALPDWALALEALLADPGDPGFVRTAGAWLDANFAAALTAEGRTGLLAWMKRALDYQARFVIAAEQQASGLSPAAFAETHLATQQHWLTFLASYPVLARLLGSEYLRWQRECRRLIERLTSNWHELGETGTPMLAGVSPLMLKRPPHGAPPLLVTLPSGKRVVYHSKDLRMAAWFNELIAHVPELAPRPVLARADHAWAEYVEASPCRDPGAYFTRLGMYLRLFQALRATDMHGRNLIIRGDHPVFIDLETLLQPQRGDADAPVDVEARARYEASPLASNLLPTWLLGEPGRRAVNIGGMNRGGDVTLPIYEAQGAKYVEPTVPGSMVEHLPQILTGYRAMSTTLATSTAIRELVARAADVRVKVLWRSGFMHKHVADQSLVPLLLTDGRLRDAYLTRLMLDLPSDAARTLALHEVWALRDGAAPAFEARASSAAIIPPDGTEVPGVFAAAALDRVELVHDDPRDIDMIATAIGLEAEARGERAPVIEHHTAPLAATALESAIAIGDFILDEAITAGDESVWFGASWCPTAGVRRLGLLPFDLLSGNAGIAVMFAYLHRRTDEPRFRDAALRALAPVKRTLGRLVYRGSFGFDGCRYAVEKCAELLRDATLGEALPVPTLREPPILDGTRWLGGDPLPDAETLMRRRRDTGRWLDDPYVAERYHLSAFSGLAAVALSLARVPELPCDPRTAS